jgi:twitching motility protein PilT
MAQIDRYVQHMLRIDARSLIISSGNPVIARLASGAERASTQVIEHATLVAAVQEVAPQQNLNDLRSSRPTKFSWPEDQPTVTIEVVPTPGAWRATLSRWEKSASDFSDAPPRRDSFSDISAARVSIGPRTATDAPAPVASVKPVASISAQKNLSKNPPEDTAAVHTQSSIHEVRDTTAMDRLLRFLNAKGASDLHISAGRVPKMRLHGEIQILSPELPVLTGDTIRAMMQSIMPEHSRQQFAETNDTDFAYEIANVARFRVNVFADRFGTCAVLRRIPSDIITAETLGLTRSMLELCDLPKGLVLVTGPTGSGKSTTLAAMLDRVNSTRRDHVITIEDPIEFVHKNKKCLINQREVRVHTDTFKDALRAALREDPDVVLVGEMRDLETVAIAIETAETGHLVFGTLHTRTAPSTVDRIIDQFPSERQQQIRLMLSDSLRGVISQTLCKKVGGGRVAAHEVLIVTPAVSNLIREGKTYQLYGTMQTGKQHGMSTLNDALCDLVKAGKITPVEAWFRSVNKSEMRNVMNHNNIVLPAGAEQRVIS